MAVYHFSARIVSRSAGRSSTAAAAYRAAERIVDERTGEIHDYTRKGGVVDSQVILPGGGTMARAELWNSVEAKHKRSDATVAREFVVALPAELEGDQRQDLARSYARELADRYGVAVDINVHAPGKDGDQRNHHAHILMSACYVSAQGELGKKAVELDPIHCQRHGLANVVEVERERWEQLANQALARAGHDARIDHRSLEAQGITDRMTDVHLGPTATAIERSGRESDIGRRAREQADQFMADMQAQVALQRAAERDVAELEAQLANARQQAEAQTERQRIEHMNSTELAQEIGRIRPPRVLDLVERDSDVSLAKMERQSLQARHTEAGSASARARDQAEAWREAHKVQAWLHDKGLGHAPKLREVEQQREAQHTEWITLARRIEDAALKERIARDAARLRINAEQAPALAKVAELEELRQEKVRQEFEQQKRQRAEKEAERERVAVPKDFVAMATNREMKADGWSNQGEQWKAAPEGLKKLIDGYTAAPKEMRPAILARITSDSGRREQVRELMAEQRQQYRENDRTYSR